MYEEFNHNYRTGRIVYGRGRLLSLESILADFGVENALLVCGSNVAANEATIGPVKQTIGSRLTDVFSGTAPSKYVGIALDGTDVIRGQGIDGLVALGGGSTLDLTKVMNALHSNPRTIDELATEMEHNGSITVPDSLLPLIVIPTTLAGADMSVSGGVQFTQDPTGPPSDDLTYGFVSDQRIMPDALIYDSAVIETTPPRLLAASAMNGFNKGIESLYSRNRNPLVDATAIHGIRVFQPALRALTSNPSGDTIDSAVVGAILVQYGIAEPGSRKANVIHAFGHISKYYPVQQGTLHGILAPHVLRSVFDSVDGQRAKLADALGIETGTQSDENVAEEIIDTITKLRDSLRIPARLRSVPDLEREHFPAIARMLLDDGAMTNRPVGYDPTQADLTAILEAAW